MRSLCWQLRYIVVVWLALVGAVHATTTPQLHALVLSPPQKNTAPLVLRALGNVPASTTVAQIAAGTAGKFTPFDPDATHEVTSQWPLRLHFRVRADSANPHAKIQHSHQELSVAPFLEVVNYCTL